MHISIDFDSSVPHSIKLVQLAHTHTLVTLTTTHVYHSQAFIFHTTFSLFSHLSSILCNTKQELI